MTRQHLRIAALAATCLLAACERKKNDPEPSVLPEVAAPTNDKLAGAGQFRGALDPDVWHFQAPDDASIVVEPCVSFNGNCARITGAHLGARSYDAQLVHWDGANVMPSYVTLSAGKQYRVQLRGRASAASTPVDVSLEDSLYRVVGASTFTLGTGAAVHTGEAIAITGSDRSVSVRVNLGGETNDGVTLSVDNVYLLEEDGPEPPDPGDLTNLLTDGDMESMPDASSWNRWANDGANATFAITDCSTNGFTGNCFRVTGSDFGANPWSTQLIKWDGATDPRFFPIDAANTYTIKFRGRAAAAGGKVQVMIQGAAPTYATPVQRDFDLTATATDYTHEFQVGASDNLAFKMGFISPTGTDQVFEVDDLQLLESEPTP